MSTAKTILRQLNEAFPPFKNNRDMIYQGDPAADGIRGAKEDNARSTYALQYKKLWDVNEGLLKELQLALNNHRTTSAVSSRMKPINYGYVGDLGNMEQQLRDILAFIRGSK